MFSQQLAEWIDSGYAAAIEFLHTHAEGRFVSKVQQAVDSCTGDVQLVMKYYFGAMPYSDLTDTDYDLLKKYAEHTVFLRNEVPWCKNIPEKTFLLDVAAYRINNEKVMECRRLFFDELYDRVKDMSMKDAVLEANYWCAEHATYHLADSRTASALTVYRSGFGRCGEESVFTVTVLRSIGIPARQVYAPLWAHCDDNHAWVEVMCDGEWYFLGACEPEEVLNKGWFTGPASRALLMHAKYFTTLPMEEADFTEGFVHYVNRVSMYACNDLFTVKVVDGDGKPMPGVTVHFELLNSAIFGNIATKITDEEGKVTIQFGFGSVRIHLVKDGAWMEKDIHTSEKEVELVFAGTTRPDGEWKEFQLHAPDFRVIHPGLTTPEQKQRNKERGAEAGKLRMQRISSWYDEKKAAPYPELDKRLRECGANFDELIRFLSRDENPYRVKLLQTLTFKDMYDLEADVLEEHLQSAMAFEGQFEEEIFVKFLLNPRVENEELSKYRSFILTWFSADEKKDFIENPKRIYEYIKNNIEYDETKDFERLRVSPKGALLQQYADPVSRKVLFCAICRTLGIPARVNHLRREVEYYCDGQFVTIAEMETPTTSASLTLEFEPGIDWGYFRDWTLTTEKDGLFRPLGLFRQPVEDGKMNLTLTEAVYRLEITTRMPSGDQFVREMTFELKDGETKTIALSKYRPKMEELLIDREISSVEAVAAKNSDGTVYRVEELAKGTRQMVLWLDPGKEPTQHVLNELLDSRERCRKLGERITVLVQDADACEEQVLSKVWAKIPEMNYMMPVNWEASESTAQQLNLPLYTYPIVYVREANGHIIYADCGYNVGSVDLMLKLMEE